MLLTITERNAWEQEAWTYVLDINKQDAAAIHELMIFARLANDAHKLAGEAAKAEQSKQPSLGGFGMFMRTPVIFASSGYTVDFYDTYKVYEDGTMYVSRSNTTMCVSRGSYKNAGLMLDAKISVSKIRSAVNAMRDKKENKLYKDFEKVFLKEKSKKGNKVATEKITV